MNIEIETLDTPRRDFADLRRELVAEGKKFSEKTLAAIPYSQLHLCCIGNAGPTACLPRLVQQEKRNRRERFLNMEPEEFKASVTYLKIEQMYDDVMYAISYRLAPKWEILSDRQKLWAKLTCLYNHIDNPMPRIDEVVEMFAQCAANPVGGLPVDVCRVYGSKLKGMATVYPGKVSDELFREKTGEIAETLLEFMQPEERKMLEKEQLQDFTCTSDCFRVLA